MSPAVSVQMPQVWCPVVAVITPKRFFLHMAKNVNSEVPARDEFGWAKGTLEASFCVGHCSLCHQAPPPVVMAISSMDTPVRITRNK